MTSFSHRFPKPIAESKIAQLLVVLKAMPPFQDLLVCGVSTQLQQQVKDFDEIIGAGDEDWRTSGLLAPSLFRLGFLAVVPQKNRLYATKCTSRESGAGLGLEA